MFGKKKEKLSPNQKAELKAQNLEKKPEKKKQKLLGPKEKKVSAVRKHITALPFVGSKIITGFSGFLAAAAFYQFEVPQDYKLAGILAGATLLSSAIGAAPYMKSVSRTNKTLATVVDSLDKIDSAVGSQNQLANLQKSLDGMKGSSAQVSAQAQSGVHTAPSNGKKNVVAE
jgi:hypothetical protein